MPCCRRAVFEVRVRPLNQHVRDKSTAAARRVKKRVQQRLAAVVARAAIRQRPFLRTAERAHAMQRFLQPPPRLPPDPIVSKMAERR